MILFSSLFNENKPFLGTFIQTASPEFLEAAGYAGFRFAAIDLEHASYGTETLVHMIRAGEAAGMSMLARVPALDTVWIKKSLDMGASGIIVPNIDTPEQAAEAVRLCRFTPEGIRGACPGVRANRYGAGGSEYYRLANENTAVIPLVESAEGVRNFAEIVHTPGMPNQKSTKCLINREFCVFSCLIPSQSTGRLGFSLSLNYQHKRIFTRRFFI